eukprot:TRINITY_DN45747_c0_g1_i1.p1 TRINITY_DN45747_c0_g1~~TRINITY_DN45747_c0_g1_i1.p1  ORF type:complete len:188 (-),score=36.96 TRINITY_DN45747_c0_g1_i1:247-810(-)
MLVVLCIGLLSVAASESLDERKAFDSGLNWENLRQHKVRDLRRALDIRGADCEACSEKGHLVNRLLEVRDQPILEPTQETPGTGAADTPGAEGAGGSPAPAGAPEPELAGANADDWLRRFQESQNDKNKDLIEALRKAGIDTTNMNFGGGGFDFDALKKKKASSSPPPPPPPPPPPAAAEENEDVEL